MTTALPALLFFSARPFISHLFSLTECSHHKWPAKGKGHRPKAEGSKTELIFISQMLANTG